LLVVGDGCTDDSEAVVRAFGDARVHWHNLPQNSGNQFAPNNAGLALARGAYVAYCGHDDVWHPEHLRTLVRTIQGTDADVVSALIEMIGPASTNYRVITGVYPPWGYDGVQGIPPSGLLHRHDVVARIGGWKDYRTIWRHPDTEFVHRAWEARLRFVSSRELTVFKFNSSLRRNSYVDRPWHEQAACQRRIERRPWFMPAEVLKIASIHLRRLPMQAPVHATPPDPTTPGWSVAQARKFRGLD
jgi:glycosyltransferase involved in cell wall biosynthesis